MIPLEAARLAAGDLAPLDTYMKTLSGEKGPAAARARMYLSWIVESDGLAEAKTPEEQRRALDQVEAEIRARASSGSRSSR
jgi:hypothetical protein